MAETCIWCGHEPLDDMTHETVYACGSVQHPRSDVWSQSTGCAEIMQSRERIQRAVEVLEGARRICVVISDENDDPIESEHDSVIYVEAAEADRAAALLRGNSLEFPDSSPVTADQLATEDYFEAVRQRVPWMTSIEHIEGLVEGYRQCGLMVWRAAEQIEKVFGGGNGQTE